MKSGQLQDIAIVYKTLYFLGRPNRCLSGKRRCWKKPANLLSASSPLLLSCPEKISQRLDHILSSNLKELKENRILRFPPMISRIGIFFLFLVLSAFFLPPKRLLSPLIPIPRIFREKGFKRARQVRRLSQNPVK